MVIRTSESTAFEGHPRGSREYRRILLALGCAGVATFAQLYSYQGVLPLLGRALQISAAQAALTVSAATIGLAAAVLPWAFLADRIGRVRAMSIAVLAATTLGLATPFAPSFEVLLAMRLFEGMALGGIPALAIAYLSEEIHRKDAAIAAGSYVAGTTLGGLAGRIIAAPVAAAAGWQAGILCVSLVGALAAAAFILLAPRSRGFTPASRMRRVPDNVVVPGNGKRDDSAADHGEPGDGRHKLSRHFRDPVMLALFAQAFLLMGGFVAVYNYLTFRLESAPFGIAGSLVSLIFLAYLSGTFSSKIAGSLGSRHGRLPVLLISAGIMAAGVLLTISNWLPLILAGLVLFTAGFFGAHSIASGWTGRRAIEGKAQAGALYNLSYYAGSSLFGWAGGLAFQTAGWSGTALFVASLIAAAVLIAALGLRKAAAADRAVDARSGGGSSRSVTLRSTR